MAKLKNKRKKLKTTYVMVQVDHEPELTSKVIVNYMEDHVLSWHLNPRIQDVTVLHVDEKGNEVP